MRIRVIQKPTATCLDGVHLDTFHVGQQYEVGSILGALLLCEGWAVPVDDPRPALVIPMGPMAPMAEFAPDRPSDTPPNLVREFFPPYYDVPPVLGIDRRRKRRDRH
jgi:hypothetical protein